MFYPLVLLRWQLNPHVSLGRDAHCNILPLTGWRKIWEVSYHSRTSFQCQWPEDAWKLLWLKRTQPRKCLALKKVWEHVPRAELCEISECLWENSKKKKKKGGQEMSLVTPVSSEQEIVLRICFHVLLRRSGSEWVYFRLSIITGCSCLFFCLYGETCFCPCDLSLWMDTLLRWVFLILGVWSSE